MKLAILSDIHSNYVAMEAVLNDLKDKSITHYIFAGDLITDGPEPIKVLNKINELKGWVIKGNREQYLLDILNDPKKEVFEYKQMAVIKWTYDQLEKKNFDYLMTLNEQEVINIENTLAIRLVHGSPDDIYEHLFFHKEERISNILNKIDEHVLICGHTHKPGNRVVNDKVIVNPGSVGLAYRGKPVAEYATLTWNEERWIAENHHVEFDYNEFERIYKNTSLLELGGTWAQATLDTIRTGENLSVAFVKFARKYAEEKGIENPHFVPNDIWDEAAELWSQGVREIK